MYISCTVQLIHLYTITPFCSRFNNYKSRARKVSKLYSKWDGHNGMEDWRAFIVRAENVLQLRHRESYCQHRLDMFIPNESNERFVGIPML